MSRCFNEERVSWKCFDQIVAAVLSVDPLLLWQASTRTQSLGGPTAVPSGRKVVTPLENNFWLAQAFWVELNWIVFGPDEFPATIPISSRQGALGCVTADQCAQGVAGHRIRSAFLFGPRRQVSWFCCMLWKQEVEGLWGHTCSLERSHLLHFYVWPPRIISASSLTRCSQTFKKTEALFLVM